MSSPLELVGKAISSVFDQKIVPENQFSIDLVFPGRGTFPPMELEVDWEPSRDFVHLAIGALFDLCPLDNREKVARLLEESAQPFLEGILDPVVPDRFGIYINEKGAYVPCFDAYVNYGSLEDGEIELVCERVLARGFRMMMMLSPVFSCIEKGYLPDRGERMSLLLKEHGSWEVQSRSTDVPGNGARLPTRLYGGSGLLMAQ
ncbi:MAG: hypothetical protein JWL87_664 [Candidatus Adlerbacteria bacterium]|nr:hypothetical protein [Candidatus Adlerbacteria bacterium]